jgi:biopolymer transport protein ExbD
VAFSIQKRPREVNIPLDSFSDIAFLLIIFFILTTSIEKMTGVRTELPAGQKSEVQQSDKTPTVNISAGSVMLNEKTVSLGQLAAELKALQLGTKRDEQRVVLLDSGPDVGYQLYFEVMAVITAHDGVIGILTEEEK